ncbi:MULTISPECIES: hypothetical protein [unclassified Paenibacillus]|uniref:hypothetical protein n=1 Tax=unclassified Paenibacillus TaxID=185978 RepID=UPI0009A5A98A|nr:MULTISPECIES: hypothetical protein [unclassified Paenibacillus]SLJ94829.1 hypothetical protein SAMN06272722_10254 [Paenibacillus sp. RU5A]SOC67460.1 hypothetical protein SAMN05880581_102944 [Paenibacillus sp. RU26A]SOC69021.1 hypothetical protein SAMN05880586_10254 [Paenibacillus sp. RU5M]
MSRVQLSIPVALLVENVLTSGEPSELIIDRLQRKEFSSLLSKIKEPTMDLVERLDTAAEVGDNWEEAIRSRVYEFKFLHINALKRLLYFRFDLKADQDYIQEDLTLKDIHLTLQETELLQLLIGRQWIVQEEEQNKDEHRDNRRDASFRIPVHIRLKY